MRKITLMAVILILILLFTPDVYSAVITVSTTQDNVPGSLRSAISIANNNSEDDTIYLLEGSYILSGETNDDANISGDLDINTDNKINIIGTGAGTTIINGNQVDRVLHILNGDVTISHLTVCNGKTGRSDSCNADPGGGIYNQGILKLIDCHIKENNTGKGIVIGYKDEDAAGDGGHGGGIYNSGDLTLDSSLVALNIAGDGGNGGCYALYSCFGYDGDGGSGGGIYNCGTQTIIDSTIIGNSAGNGGNSYGDDGGGKGDGGDGGGIYNCGSQTITRCLIKDNTTGVCWFTYFSETAGRGGGIFNSGSQSDISYTQILFNTTGKCVVNCVIMLFDLSDGIYGGDGGGIYNSGSMKLTYSSVSSNTTGTGSVMSGSGGGIYNNNDLKIENSTISSNIIGDGETHGDSGHGGGICNDAQGHVILINSTISANRTGNGSDEIDYWYDPGSGGNGGGIYNKNQTDIANCTITENSCGKVGDFQDSEGEAEDGNGGGIYNETGSLHLKNTIVANNSLSGEGEGKDCWGQINSQGYNLIKNSEDYILTGDQTGNMIGVDPNLGDLADNGGPTGTHSLLPGSPAIDAGNSENINRDQRGFSRPFDVPGINNIHDGSDIGAFELNQITTSFRISGKITHNGIGLPGVSLTFSNEGGAAITDAYGDYSQLLPTGWSGTVTPSLNSYSFSPASRTYASIIGDISNQDYTAEMEIVIPPQITVSRNQMTFVSDLNGSQSGVQSFLISNSGGGILNWTVTDDADWLMYSPTKGTDSAQINVSIEASGLSEGTYNGAITISDPNAANSPQLIAVELKVLGTTAPPFGSFDGPLDGTTVAGSVPVTGWVLDDIGIENVNIYRSENNSLVFIGEAVLVEGARPDIEIEYPDYPNHSKAGWGYMMLTNMLPNQGNGDFTIFAKATDKEGNEVTLGSKTITCDNANAVKPFGAIETPDQGGNVAGYYFFNWGWVLTPQPNMIPVDGSTINVWVDGVNLGHPTYNLFRSDIADLFPGYANTNGAVGYFIWDSTLLNNGLHTLHWTATDSAGNTDGIGSRFFTHQNGYSQSPSNSTIKKTLHHFKQDFDKKNTNYSDGSLKIVTGLNKKTGYHEILPKENKSLYLELKECEPIEIEFPDNITIVSCHLMVNNKPTVKPIGSTVQSNKFSWFPSPGFIGSYQLCLVVKDQSNQFKQLNLRIRLMPKF